MSYLLNIRSGYDIQDTVKIHVLSLSSKSKY